MDAPHWADLGAFAFAAATFTGGVAYGVYTAQSRIRRWRRVVKSFDLRQAPAPYTQSKQVDFKSFATEVEGHGGMFELTLCVKISHKLDVREITLRPVATKKGGDVPDDTVRITKLSDAYLDYRKLPSTVQDYVANSDKASGYSIWYTPPFTRASNEYLWFTVLFEAKKSWSGYLSFGSTTVNGELKHSRRKFTVDAPPASQSEPSSNAQ